MALRSFFVSRAQLPQVRKINHKHVTSFSIATAIRAMGVVNKVGDLKAMFALQ
jgi:hypothetical protein